MKNQHIEQKEAIEEFYRRAELDAVMDEEDAARRESAHYRECARLVHRFYKTGLRLALQYPGNRLMAMDALALAIGEPDLIEMPEHIQPRKTNNAVKVAIKHFANPKKKAAVNKLILIIQAAMGIPPMPGQRSIAGKINMETARNNQLKK